MSQLARLDDNIPLRGNTENDAKYYHVYGRPNKACQNRYYVNI